MKKIIYPLLVLLTVALAACYPNYIEDFDHDSVYFPYQTNVRTLVVGEGMKIEVGAALGGVRENNRDRNVSYTLDSKLITSEILTRMKNGSAYIKEAVAPVTAFKLLPANYYSISNNSAFVIKAGKHSGSVVIKADSTAFLGDTSTIMPVYVLPFYITKADADTLLEQKRYAVIAIKYENMLFGNYWHGGVTTIKNAANQVVNTVKYYTTIPAPESKVWKLTTVAPNALETNGISDKSGAIRLSLNGGKITVSTAKGSKVSISADGESTYNQAKLLQNRKIVLKYKYDNGDGTTSYAQDTLTFRNRIRDGVNEWQDENPGNY